MLLGFLVGGSGASSAIAQDDDIRDARPILVVLDVSGSMRETDGSETTRMEEAKSAIRAVVDGIPGDIEVGLRVFAHRDMPNREASCEDTELLVPIGPVDRDAIAAALEPLEPNGYTPIGESLLRAQEDFDGRPGTIILVSDGLDTCAPPDPCEVARAITEDGLELRIETVGFHIDQEAGEQLRCIAEATDGTFREVDDEASLIDALATLRGVFVEGTPRRRDAPLIEPDTYLTEVGFGEQRWFAVEPAPGQTVEVDIRLAASTSMPDIAGSRFGAELARGDALGALVCDQDAGGPIGPAAVIDLSLVGSQIDTGAGGCARPDRYHIGFEITAPERRSSQDPEPPADPLDVQFTVRFDGEPEPEPEPVSDPEPPPPPTRTPPPEPTASTSGGMRALVGLLLGGIGFTAGSLTARRAGA